MEVIGDVTFADLAAHFEPAQITEICLTVGMSNMINRFHAAFRTGWTRRPREALASACPACVPHRHRRQPSRGARRGRSDRVADLLADAAEGADGTGRPLFSGLRGRGRPGDPFQRLWWACDLVREHRGDSHVAVVNAAGLGPVEMNVLTECWLGMPQLSYTATRGWPEGAMRAAVDGTTMAYPRQHLLQAAGAVAGQTRCRPSAGRSAYGIATSAGV